MGMTPPPPAPFLHQSPPLAPQPAVTDTSQTEVVQSEAVPSKPFLPDTMLEDPADDPVTVVESEPIQEAETLPPFLPEDKAAVTIDELLRYSVDAKASDLHVKAGAPPTVRISGHLHPMDYRTLDATEAFRLADAMLSDKERGELQERGEVDFAYSMSGVGRFRVNIHRQRGSLGIASRRILPNAPDFAELDLPPVVEKLANEHRGLLLITGPTSSGKTTTCGSIIKHINHTRRCHIVTIEDPIEIMHADDKAIVTQREVGQDTTTFQLALRAAMRQDPDVIFVGEIRDTETVQAALQAAETGHFVIATLHTTDVVETVNRIVDFFPSHQQKQVRIALAGSLVGVMTQRLLPKIGGGRAAAVEVLVSNGRIKECIMDGDKTHEIHDIVKESEFYGMQSFDQAMIKLYQAGKVSLEDAKSGATNPHDFQLAMQQAGILAP
jgi:twitching motility protein PilT